MKTHRHFLQVMTLAALMLACPNAQAAVNVTGTVTYEGEIPKFKEIQMDADPICLSHNKEKVFPQSLVLGENKTLGNVFVRLTRNVPKVNYPPPDEPVVINQEGCMYHPHVLGIMVGQTLKILNPDGTLHNVHVLSKVNPEFNLAMPKFRIETSKVFDKPEFMFPIKCDVHPWMGAWVTVMDHPYFNVTGVDGRFTIKDVPAGTYDIEAWHEKLGTRSATINVTGGGDNKIDFTFSRQ